ncbi:gamma-glutamylcyclotransferase family protein [Halovenus sp. HT40]|uniref:gamma-glutamylcyclotransferase family protein n=1 Tax=Halovenus sp. HT40 TaxID=3126691 RepID=UPI00300EA950
MDVFVYGTLTDRERTADILERFSYRSSAVLDGLHRVDGRYPTLSPGGETTGRILSTPEIDALDGYEGVASGLYVRVTVPRAEDGTVDVYVGDPTRLGVSDDWPAGGSVGERVRQYIDSNCVVVREQY